MDYGLYSAKHCSRCGAMVPTRLLNMAGECQQCEEQAIDEEREDMSDKPNEYVLGFIFDPTGQFVLLMQKQRPAWQRHKFNGIGGHLKEDESPADAMVRECEEETGERIDDWRLVCSLRGDWGIVTVFATFTEAVTSIEMAGDEPVSVHPVEKLPPNVIPNLRWLIPMCVSFTLGEPASHFEVKEF